MERALKFYFFKIILKCAIEDNKLRLPTRFVRNYTEKLANMDTAKLKVINRNGRDWLVEVKKEKDDILLNGPGFKKFIEHHSIEPGHLLIFQYKGKSSFKVVICDKSACQVEIPCHDQKKDAAGPCNIVESSEDDEDEILAVDPSLGTRKRMSRKKVTPSHQKLRRTNSSTASDHLGINKEAASVGRKRKGKDIQIDDFTGGRFKRKRASIAEPEFEKEGMKIFRSFRFNSALAEASQGTKDAVHRAMMSKPKNPAFIVIMQAHNINCCSGSLLYVPTEFATRYMEGVDEYIELQISNGEKWHVRAKWRKGFGVNLEKGWREFTKHNGLKTGDVCLFELIKLKGMVGLHAKIIHS